MNYDDAADLIRKHEGYRNRLYMDSLGNLTGGIGHLFSVGSYLPCYVVERLFYVDFSKTISDYQTICQNYKLDLDTVRRAVLLNMVFNLGISKIMKFVKFFACLKKGDYEGAADEMLDSKWASQVKGRAVELAEMMRTGTYDLPGV